MRIRKPFNSISFLLQFLVVGGILVPNLAWAIHFPDSSDYLKNYRIAARKSGKPADLYHRVNGDSASLHLDWKGNIPISVRFEQSREFAPDSFSVLVSAFGGGGAWHELPLVKADSSLRKACPGLEQQWLLKGYGGEKGWMGSGLQRGRFFLIFRETAPVSRPQETLGPLGFGANFFASLDTSSEWLHVPCQDVRKGTHPICFVPGKDIHSRIRIRIQRQSPLLLDIWWDEEGSNSLLSIKSALLSLPDLSQSEYAQDLSNMLLGEAQLFLAKLSQRLPQLFTWPSWQWQDCKAGRIPPQNLLNLIRHPESIGDSLPAFHYTDQGGIRIDVDLFFKGTLHVKAEDRF
jgi:hypothetical protein